MAGAEGPIIRQTRQFMRYFIRLLALLYLGCVCYYIRLYALLYKVACAIILGCVRYNIRLCALLY